MDTRVRMSDMPSDLDRPSQPMRTAAAGPSRGACTGPSTHPLDAPCTDTTATADAVQWAETLIHQRRTQLPKRLCGPGPDAGQRHLILRAASAAPDHGQLLPWRFMEIPATQRGELAEVFTAALRERDPSADAESQAQAAEKAHRAPWLLLVVCRVRGGDAEIPAAERLLSAGCAVQNMLLMAQAMDLGASLTSGKALASLALRQRFGLSDEEEAVCFLNVGHVREPRAARPRPSVDDYFSVLSDTRGV